MKAKIQGELLKNISAVLAGDPIVYLSEFQGEFAIDSRSELFWRIAKTQHYEQRLAQLAVVSVDENDDVIDIGANIGFYSVLLAQYISANNRVLAIEPTIQARARLEKNILRNSLEKRIIVVAGAVTNASGTAKIHVVPGREEYSSIGSLSHPAIRDSGSIEEVVPCFTLDELVATHALRPGFMKIDVEGAERKVLEGAEDTIRKHRPVILTELSDQLLREQGSCAKEVLKIFRQWNYKVFDAMYFDLIPGARDFGDLICIPEESPKKKEIEAIF